MAQAAGETFDYVVVGSGAGGGTVAARLAEAGMSVLVIEAGADPAELKAEGLPQDYDVPAFHPFASENEAMAWNFWVHDYGDDAKRRSRSAGAFSPGVLYPRCSTLGGCTAHNAMILMVPHDSDWNAVADLTGDASWRAENMRRYFERIDDCRYRPLWRALTLLTRGRFNPTRHGWAGWLPSERPLPAKAFGDHALMCAIRNAVRADLVGGSDSYLTLAIKSVKRACERWARLVIGEADPNDRRLEGRLDEGLAAVPLSTLAGKRRGARERILSANETHGLRVEFDALAARVLFDADNRAVGVEYLKGRNLYRASPLASGGEGERRQVFVRREVILAGGAFNTPQLLMLSGIGPKEQLRSLGIDARIALEGVGRNLQDRYEVGVVHKTKRPWACLQGVEFSTADRAYTEWLHGRGMYPSNGAAVAFTLRSSPSKQDPDLFVMALLTRFSGYFPGYSKVIRASRGDLTFAVLKAHTNNRAGRVSLISKDPRDPARVDFRYFEEGTDDGGGDLAAVVEGLRRVRAMASGVGAILEAEDIPGAMIRDKDALAQFVRENAWGHHASCTCPIGAPDNGGVLTSDFRVHGTKGLRVVDASVFPRIPGFFIVCAIYMIAEKAADVILAAAQGAQSEAKRAFAPTAN